MIAEEFKDIGKRKLKFAVEKFMTYTNCTASLILQLQIKVGALLSKVIKLNSVNYEPNYLNG